MRTRQLTRGGLIAALYTVLTLALMPISFGPVQLRVAEALAILPILVPEAIPGLFVGCLLSNLVGMALGRTMWQDVVFGPIASLLAALCAYALRKRPALALVPSVLLNAVIVGGMLSVVLRLPLVLTMGEVALGQLVACYALGLPLLMLLRRLPPTLLG